MTADNNGEGGIDIATARRATATMGYPLPPTPPRFEPTFNFVKQYLLPHPVTGRATAFARVTTVAGTLPDYFGLQQWKQRTKIAAVLNFLRDPDGPVNDRLKLLGGDRDAVIDVLSEQVSAQEPGQALNTTIDLIDSASGGSDAAELGQAVHAWLEAVDLAQVRPADVPAMFQPHLAAYRDVLSRHALVPVPRYVERVVLNDNGIETVVGTLDRVFCIVTDGELVLGDIKTSKTLDYSWLEYSVQLALYRYARLMLAVDGSHWEPMPELNGSVAYLIHVPSNQPERSSCVTFDMGFGTAAAELALAVRDVRREAKHRAPYVHAIPTPTTGALRYIEARHAVQDISDPAELAGVWERYQDVWTDDLTELGGTVAGLFE